MFEDMGAHDLFALDSSDLVYRKWIKDALRRGKVVGWIVEVDGQLADSGCIWLQHSLPNPHGETKLVRPYLFSMYTESEFRRRGVASLILRGSVAWCKKNGFQRMRLHASKKGRAFYQEYGFVRTWEMEQWFKVTNVKGRIR
jgi:GNAT superfamily N-acetyltransferase